jgi:hypothetical protein
MQTYSSWPGHGSSPDPTSRRQEETCAVCFELNDQEAICVDPPGTACVYGETRAQCEGDARILDCDYVSSIPGTLGAVLQSRTCEPGSRCVEAATGALCQPIEIPSLAPNVAPGT